MAFTLCNSGPYKITCEILIKGKAEFVVELTEGATVSITSLAPAGRAQEAPLGASLAEKTKHSSSAKRVVRHKKRRKPNYENSEGFLGARGAGDYRRTGDHFCTRSTGEPRPKNKWRKRTSPLIKGTPEYETEKKRLDDELDEYMSHDKRLSPTFAEYENGFYFWG